MTDDLADRVQLQLSAVCPFRSLRFRVSTKAGEDRFVESREVVTRYRFP